MQIQVAGDFSLLEEAFSYFGKLQGFPSLIFEYGAPLVVNCGVDGYTRLKSQFERLVYVDCKTMDFPSLEWSRYIDEGAKEITGMLFAEQTVISEMAEINSSKAVKVCVSTMGYPTQMLRQKVEQMRDLGFTAFIAHAAHAERNEAFRCVRRQLDILSLIEGIELFAGGGIRADNIEELRGYPLSRIIAGRSIAKEKDPQKRLRDLVEQVTAIFG